MLLLCVWFCTIQCVCVWIYVRFRYYPRAWHQGRLAVWHLPVSPARKRGIVRRLASLWSALSGGRSLRRLPSPWSLEMLRTWNVFPSETIGVHGHQKKGRGDGCWSWWLLCPWLSLDMQRRPGRWTTSRRLSQRGVQTTGLGEAHWRSRDHDGVLLQSVMLRGCFPIFW